MLLVLGFLAGWAFTYTAGVCPENDVQACLTKFASQAQSVDFSYLDQICRIYGELEACITSYDADCNGNSVYNAAVQTMSSTRQMCPTAGGTDTTTTMSNEIPIDVHDDVVSNSSESVYEQSEESLCFKKMNRYGCLPPNPEKTLKPPGSLTTGYNISSEYIANFCRIGRHYVQCVDSPVIRGDPNCASLADMFNTQKAIVDVLCDAKGRATLEKIRRCANNHELQIELYGYQQKRMGIGEGRGQCGYNNTETICTDVTDVASGMLNLVESSCGYSIKTTVQALLVRLAASLVVVIPPETGFNCPNIADRIRNL